MEKLIIATRASDLALWQAYHIKARIEKSYPNIKVELNKIVSKLLGSAGKKKASRKEDLHTLIAGARMFVEAILAETTMSVKDILLLNSAVAFVVDEKARDIQDGLEIARECIAKGLAKDKLKQIIKISNISNTEKREILKENLHEML